jgi:heat shock protein HtpX
MNFIKRIGLFLLVNICVVLTLSFIINLLGLKPYLTKQGLDPVSLLIFCFIWGMGGAFISLQMSRFIAKSMMGIQILNDHPSSAHYLKLVMTTKRLCEKAGLKYTPEIGVYNSQELNAFATGPSERRSLIAVSSGLLNKMTDDELEGVLAHEIAHIKNGDMVTMTLLQGVVNAFVMFLARILAYFLASRGKNNDSRSMSWGSYMMLVYLFEIVFLIAGSMVIAAFSRFREFRADKGGAQTAGTLKMVAALERLKNELYYKDPQHAPQTKEQPALAYMKISGHKPHGFTRLFASHPPLEERIRRLKARI